MYMCSKFKQGIVNKKKNPHVLRRGCNVIIGKLHKKNKKMDIEQKQLRNRSQFPEWERPWVKKRERERGGVV